MKAVINYDKRKNLKKFYLINFIYDDISEENKLISYLKKMGINYDNNEIKNISNESLDKLTNLLITEFNSKIIFCNDISNIEDRDEKKQHSIAILRKGNYFNCLDTYYILFDYTNDSDIEQLLYYFNSELNNMTYNLNMHPYIISKKKNNMSGKNFVRATNIPRDLIPFFLKKFIEEYHMIIYVDDYILKDKFDNNELLECISKLENKNIKVRKKQNI